jgi:hypothetical protein
MANSLGSSPGRRGLRERRPWRERFRAVLALPSGVLGPVESRALRRLASIRRWKGSVRLGFRSTPRGGCGAILESTGTQRALISSTAKSQGVQASQGGPRTRCRIVAASGLRAFGPPGRLGRWLRSGQGMRRASRTVH